jgi:hypothetical protein
MSSRRTRTPSIPQRQLLPSRPICLALSSRGDGFTLIPDVRVEIVDGGIDTGKYDQTRVNGAYLLEHLRMGVPLTVRASKPGYVASTQTHPGIVDDSSGYPEPNSLHFRLARVAGS